MPVIYGKNHKASEDDGYSSDSGMDSKDGMAKDDNDDAASALIPKSVIGDHKLKPGDQVILEVVHVYEDEVEVKYGKKDKKEESDEDEGESSESQMDASQKELDNMAQE